MIGDKLRGKIENVMNHTDFHISMIARLFVLFTQALASPSIDFSKAIYLH